MPGTWPVFPEMLAISFAGFWNLGAFCAKGCCLPTEVGPIHAALRGLPQ